MVDECARFVSVTGDGDFNAIGVFDIAQLKQHTSAAIIAIPNAVLLRGQYIAVFRSELGIESV